MVCYFCFVHSEGDGKSLALGGGREGGMHTCIGPTAKFRSG